MRDKILKASYILAWIGAIWFLLSSESSLWYLVPGALSYLCRSLVKRTTETGSFRSTKNCEL